MGEASGGNGVVPRLLQLAAHRPRAVHRRLHECAQSLRRKGSDPRGDGQPSPDRRAGLGWYRSRPLLPVGRRRKRNRRAGTAGVRTAAYGFHGHPHPSVDGASQHDESPLAAIQRECSAESEARRGHVHQLHQRRAAVFPRIERDGRSWFSPVWWPGHTRKRHRDRLGHAAQRLPRMDAGLYVGGKDRADGQPLHLVGSGQLSSHVVALHTGDRG